jgi:hypothetical protein
MLHPYPEQHNRPRFYVAGFISLLLLFPLCMVQLKQYHAAQKAYVLEVVWYDPDHPGVFGPKAPPARDYQVIDIAGHKEHDRLKLNYAQLAIREMLHRHDTLTGIKIHFADTARYGSFIHALDICHQENAQTFVAFENDLWIFNDAEKTDTTQPPGRTLQPAPYISL